MDVFFQQEGALAPFLFFLSLIAVCIFFLLPFLLWRIAARSKENGDKLQEISNRLERVIETLVPQASLSIDPSPLDPMEEDQVAFDFDDTTEESASDEIGPFDTSDSTDAINTDEEEDSLEFDFSDDFDAAATPAETGAFHPASNLDSNDDPDLTDAFASADNLDSIDDLDLSEAFNPTEELDFTDDLDSIEISDNAEPSVGTTLTTPEEGDSTEEVSREDEQSAVTAATLSLDVDFGLDKNAPEFASGPEEEFGFEFDDDFGDLGEPDPATAADTTPLTFDEEPDALTDERFGDKDSSFTFETEEENAPQSLDRFPDIEFTDDAPAPFETTETATEDDRLRQSLDDFPDTDFSAETDENSDEDAPDPLQGMDDVAINTESFTATPDRVEKEEIKEDFAAAFDEIEPSLSTESLDDIAASILKDQESSAAPIPEIRPEPESVPEIRPEPTPAAKPATLFARCEGCNHKLAYKETLSGKRVRCPACSAAFKLP